MGRTSTSAKARVWCRFETVLRVGFCRITNEETSAEAINTVEPTSSAYVDYVWSGHLKSRGLVSVSNEEVHWNSGTINIIEVLGGYRCEPRRVASDLSQFGIVRIKTP